MATILSKLIRRFERTGRRLVFVAGALSLALPGRPSVADDVLVAAEPAQAVMVMADNGPLRAQYEPMLKVELSFVNRACQLTEDERRLLISKSSAWLTTFVAEQAKHGNQPQNMMVWIAGANRNVPKDARESIREEVAKLVKKHLPKEKAAIYDDECQKRSEFSKRVAVESIVAQMDKKLLLLPDQREKIDESLNKHWDKSWAPQLEMFTYGMELWPNVPQQWIRPHLTPTQQTEWSRVAKTSGNQFFGGGMFGMENQVIDDIDLSEGKNEAHTK